MLVFCVSLIKTIWFFSFISETLSGNIATEHVTYLRGRLTNSSQFGYSVVIQKYEEIFTFWVGAPKYSIKNNNKDSPGKPGAVFRCNFPKNKFVLSGDNELHCSMIDIKETKTGHDDKQFHSNNIEMSLDLNNCDFNTSQCGGFNIDPKSDFSWRITKSSGWGVQESYKNCYFYDLRQRSFNRKWIRITGVPSFTVNDVYLDASFSETKKKLQETVLVSPKIETRRGYVQCLRFCFNAYTALKSARRNLEVWNQYLDSDGNESSEKQPLFNFSSLTQEWSQYWNYTEINVIGAQEGFYKIYFKATVYPYMCENGIYINKSADIALSDVSLSNMPCEEELSNVDEILEEESLGLTIENKKVDEKKISLATCGPLWQHNCGYAREADGVCYEITVNRTQVQNITRHKPLSRECIRGKMDVLLVVDQSASVNHCNFQKIKRWLRNIVRGFNIGKNEQDIGIIVYSSRDKTNVVIPLGFSGYSNSGASKKEETIQTLKTLPYAAGATFTGDALKLANQALVNGRKEAKKIIILLTDGATSRNNKRVLNLETKTARSNNHTILAVGVGNFNKTELIGITGSEDNFFSVKRFSELDKIRDSLRTSLKRGSLEGANKNKNQSYSLPQQCQMGFSLHYLKNILLMGSPGCYRMSGNIISHPNVRNNSFYVDDASKSEGEKAVEYSPATKIHDAEAADYEKDIDELSSSNNYVVPTLSQLQKFFPAELADSYLGYKVTSGHFFGQHEPELIASSAPRYNIRGAVLIYYSFNSISTLYRHRLDGQQLGEYFGASLHACDVNSDGYTDLLVGAPLHIGLQPDEGRVYLYMGAKNMSNNPDIVLQGSKIAFSRFGSYVTSVGDINRDTYQDIAVSAPEENQGTVYIFYGSKDGVWPKYVQRIDPIQLRPSPTSTFKKFGQIIKGNFDIDDNKYPDILLGVPENDVLVLLLSRPVMNVYPKLHIPIKVDARSDPCRNPTKHSKSCLECAVCFAFNGTSVNSKIPIEFILTVDVNHALPRFVSSQDPSTNNILSSISLKEKNVFYCRNFSFALKKKTRDLMSAITFSLKYQLYNNHELEDQYNHLEMQQEISPAEGSRANIKSGSELEYGLATTIRTIFDSNTSSSQKIDFSDERNVELHPILSLSSNTSIVKTTHFKTFCNVTILCKTNLSVEAYIVNKSGAKLESLLLSYMRLVILRVRIANDGPEDAYDVTVDVHYPDVLFQSAIKKVAHISNSAKANQSGTPCFHVDKTAESNSLKLLLRQNILEKDQFCSVDIVFGLLKFDAYSHTSFKFIVNASTISNDVVPDNNIVETLIPVTYSGKILFDGYPKRQTILIKTNSTLFPFNTSQKIVTESHLHQHYFVISNIGAVPLGHVKFLLGWPVQLHADSGQAKYDLLYIKDITCLNNTFQTVCNCGPDEIIDPYGIFRNSSEFLLNESALRLPKQNISKYIKKCAESSSNCYANITCDIFEIPLQTTIHVRVEFIAFPNTLSMLETSARLASNATISLSGNHVVDLTAPNGLVVEVLDILEPIDIAQLQDDGDFNVPWWIYAASCAAGLMMFVLLLLLLKKCGFFKSKYAAKKQIAEKNKQDLEPLKT